MPSPLPSISSFPCYNLIISTTVGSRDQSHHSHFRYQLNFLKQPVAAEAALPQQLAVNSSQQPAALPLLPLTISSTSTYCSTVQPTVAPTVPPTVLPTVPLTVPSTALAIIPPTAAHHHTVPDYMPPSRQFTDLSKAYTNEMKYGGGKYDVLETKLLIFRDTCQKVGIPQAQFAGVFSTMLMDRALTFYFNNLYSTNLDFHTMVSRLQQQFETETRHQRNLTEWQIITLPKIIQDNPSKAKDECLEILLVKLSTLQQALIKDYHTDKILRDQVVNACIDVKECDHCLNNPGQTYEAVCEQLRAAISSATRRSQQQQYTAGSAASPTASPAGQTEQYWTDRTYNGRGRNSRFNRSHRQSNRPFRSNHCSSGNTPPLAVMKCYICSKPGCCSTKHPIDERRKAYYRYRSSQYVQDRSIAAFIQFLA